MEKENLALKAFVVIMKSSKSLEEIIKKDISSHGMKSSDFTVLEALYHKGSQTVREISNAVLINTGSITYVIDKLEKKGYVKRRHCQEDRRVVYVDITDEGTKQMDEIFPKHQQVIEELFSDVSDEEKQTVIQVLKRVGKKGDKPL
jgi:MarR family 2-MHQ and catechol resistance regulon transcriptional repressor